MTRAMSFPRTGPSLRRPRSPWSRLSAAAALAAAALAACVGDIGVPGGSSGSGGPGGGSPAAQAALEAARTGMRRLSAVEFNAAVSDLVGVDVTSETVLPEDERRPFDNDYTRQLPSEALINSADVLAGDIASKVVADSALRAKIVPCTPSGADDAVCFRQFLQSFGRRAFRRPLGADELGRFETLLTHATEENDFWVGVESALRAFLQHPAFVYRIELGTAVAGKPGVFRLTDFELATRLSFLLLGTTPPDSLLDATEAGKLSTKAGVQAVTKELLQDARARRQIARFHSMWLGYERMPHSPSLSSAMLKETQALLDKVIFDDKRPWLDVLTAKETFVTPELATHYGLPSPNSSSGGWVSYGNEPRQGLLSHGSFLSAVAKFSDTSPTQRGLLIRRRLLCEDISPPPPSLKVNADMPPEGSDPTACKSERYNMWKTDGCSLCHSKMEPIGFGLENFDAAGKYRTHEPDRPDCEITGQGKLEGIGDFSGPVDLSNRLLESGGIESCMTAYYVRYALGRYDLDERDETFVQRLMQDVPRGELRMEDMILQLVSQEAFRLRREESL